MKKKSQKFSLGKELSKCIMLPALLLFFPFSSFSQPLQLQTETNFSEEKYEVYAAVVGNKVFFGGGQIPMGGGLISKIEIYDLESETWNSTSFSLSVPRITPAVACDNKVYFGGGITAFGPIMVTDVVDILDTEMGIMTTAQLSVPRHPAGVANDSIVIFAGGWLPGGNLMSDAVDILNVNTGVWTTAQLSEARDASAAVVIGDLAIFAGGKAGYFASKRVDIYNFATGMWSIDSLSEARAHIGATVVDGKAYFAGGMRTGSTASDVIDVYNYSKGGWTIEHLSQPRAFLGNYCVGTVCGKAVFANGALINYVTNTWTSAVEAVDIYDSNEDEWCTMEIPNHQWDPTVVAVDTFLVVATGGPPHASLVSIYSGCGDCVTVSVPSIDQNFDFTISPNPARNNLNINAIFKNKTNGTLSLYNVSGHTAYQYEFTEDMLEHQIDLSSFAPGIYMVEIRTESGRIVEKVMILE